MMLLKRTEVRMAKNKFVVSLMLAALLMLPVSAEVKLDDVTTPKDIFYRLGTTDTPENKIDVNSRSRLQRHDGRFVASLAGCGNKKRYN